MGLSDSGTPTGSGSRSGSRSSSSSTSSCAGKASEMDGLLAGAGYNVKYSDLGQVAQNLERLETIMVNAPSEISQQLSSEVVHYNPSNMASWVDSLLSEISQNQPLPFFSSSSDLSDFSTDLHYMEDLVVPSPPLHQYSSGTDTWIDQNNSLQHQQQLTAVMAAAMEEDSGIRLVHLLMICAESVQRGDVSLAGSLITDMQNLLAQVNRGCGIGKVAGYFIDALTRRLFCPQAVCAGSAQENEILYRHFYEACPYLKFSHFTANQAMLEAFDGQDCVHVIDFNLMHGLQWPVLIQALALRPGGPPFLRLTGIGPPSPDGGDSIHEIGLNLTELARSVNVRFVFRYVAATRLEDVKPWVLKVGPTEVVAVNSIMQLHRLLNSDQSLDTVLAWIRSLNPKIVTVVEQEANHNQPEFLDRFTEALYYYSAMFDSLEACSLQSEKAVAEMYIQREICNIVCCEGLARVERHEPLAKWKARLGAAGFRPLHLGSNAFKQATMLLTLFSAEGYCVEEMEGCLTLGWHSRPIIAASAWQAVPDPAQPHL
ncbi:DELLA protein GAI1-like [Telopea speciosissima]|uniref:DELLA protein GAI1-like n=1 Tax=Telopea speciosissima TaxID=54955 RepID=UPI001CC7BA7F|nr:DELLA protein GAI1-like [Telopea speciosissima]